MVIGITVNNKWQSVSLITFHVSKTVSGINTKQGITCIFYKTQFTTSHNCLPSFRFRSMKGLSTLDSLLFWSNFAEASLVLSHSFLQRSRASSRLDWWSAKPCSRFYNKTPKQKYYVNVRDLSLLFTCYQIVF